MICTIFSSIKYFHSILSKMVITFFFLQIVIPSFWPSRSEPVHVNLVHVARTTEKQNRIDTSLKNSGFLLQWGVFSDWWGLICLSGLPWIYLWVFWACHLWSTIWEWCLLVTVTGMTLKSSQLVTELIFFLSSDNVIVFKLFLMK